MKLPLIQNKSGTVAYVRPPTAIRCHKSPVLPARTGACRGQRRRSMPIVLLLLALLHAITGASCLDKSVTGEQQSPDTNTLPMFELIPGVWVRQYASGHEEYDFDPTGAYAFRAYTNGKITPDQTSTGTWSASADFLTINTEITQEISPFVVNLDAFSRTQVYLRKSVAEGGLEGTWEYRVERFQTKGGQSDPVLTSTRTDTLVLFGDGTSTFSSQELTASGVTIGQAIVDRPGTWISEGDTITVSDSVHVVEFKQVGDRIYDTNSSWIYTFSSE